MGSFIRVLNFIGAKIAENIKRSIHEFETSLDPEWDFDSSRFFNPQLNSPCKDELNLKLNPDLCKLFLNPIVA